MKKKYEKGEIVENENCEFIENCAIHRKSISGSVNSIFLALYCRGIRLGWCECRKHFMSGQAPPENLLPNGEHINDKMNMTNLVRL